MTAMKLLILTWVAAASAFQPVTHRDGASRMTLYGKQKTIDERKIKDAAGHFGKYSVRELEEIKDGTWACARETD